MAEMGLKGKAPVRRRRTTDSRHDFPRFPNLVEGLEVTRPDQVWAADITYVRPREEFVYLAVVMDVFTRRVRGWELGRNLVRGSPWRSSRSNGCAGKEPWRYRE
jgi:transposase InsO family protein